MIFLERKFAYRGDGNLRLLPLGHAVDPVEGFIRGRRKSSARSEVEVEMNVNAVHLSAVGGRQTGDAIAAMLMALAGAGR